MNFEEHAAKPLLAQVGIPVPQGAIAATPEAAGEIARRLGPVVVKAQVPAGKRGKAGGVKPAEDAEGAGSLPNRFAVLLLFHALADRARLEESGEAERDDRPRFLIALKQALHGIYTGGRAQPSADRRVA